MTRLRPHFHLQQQLGQQEFGSGGRSNQHEDNVQGAHYP